MIRIGQPGSVTHLLTPIPLLLPVGMLAVGLACVLPASASPAALQDTVEVSDEGPGPWGEVSPVEELRIGVLEGDEHYVFGQVLHILPVSDDRVWVVDAQGPRIRIYDGEGRLVREVGELGEGPGEFLRVHGLDLTADGRVALWDGANRRISFYDPNGDFDGQLRVDVTGSGSGFTIDTSGTFWVPTGVINPACTTTTVGLDGNETQLVRSEGSECIRPAFLRLDGEDAAVDTIYVPLPESRVRPPRFGASVPSGGVVPFISDWTVALSPLGYPAAAHTSRYRVDLHLDDPAGPEVLRVTRSFDPVPIVPAERNEWEAIAGWYDRRFPESVMSDVSIPETKPALRYIRFGPEGRLWVRRYVEAASHPEPDPGTDPEGPPPLTWWEPPVYDVFEADGRFLGTVVLPDDVRLMVRGRDRLWGVARGDFGEEYVVRLRMPVDGPG